MVHLFSKCVYFYKYNANQILVLDNGKIVQRGTHEELIKIDGIYKNFVEARQMAVGWKLS